MNKASPVRWAATTAAAGVLGMMAAAANAVPVMGNINSANNFSVVHTGSNPGGAPPDDEWYWFDEGQMIALDYRRNELAIAAPQSFSLSTRNGAIGSLLITDMVLDITGSDGFSGGSLSYVLNGQTTGSFDFADQQYGNSPFNSSTLDDGLLTVNVWGGDDLNNLGIDLSISATVPEPGTLLLMGLGVLGLMVARGRA